MMLKLLKNAEVYTPKYIGKKDILLAERKIIAIDDAIEATSYTQVIDLAGKTVIPGLIDQHVHLIGGGGEDGYRSLIEEVDVDQFVKYGVCSVVGLLGTDHHVKNVRSLVVKCKALKEGGMSAYCLTGSYALPSITVTGDVGDDIVYIDEVIGVKVAINDHRSSHPSKQDLMHLASSAYTSGLLSHKAGVVHMHVGRGKYGLKDIFEILEESDIPISVFRPTHIGNCLNDGIEFAKKGGYIDFTAGSKTAGQILRAAKEVPLDQITMSSDANGSFPLWGENHTLIGMSKGKSETLWQTVKELIDSGMKKEDALAIVTRNVAEALKLRDKGKIEVGCDGDIVVLNEDSDIEEVYCLGECLYSKGKVLYQSYYRK